jgi:hypothetical protein
MMCHIRRGLPIPGLLLLLAVLHPAVAGAYKPWDELTRDSWIDFFDSDDPNIYPANAADSADVASSYPLSFSQAGGGNKAKGMNALIFIHGGERDGHLVSTDHRGSFKIGNSGDHNVFTDVLIVVAIDAVRLNDGFSLSLNMEGRPPYRLGPEHFAYYDSPLGRPSGYYSATDPNREGLTYVFETGMVTVYGVAGLSAGLAPGQDLTIEYAFDRLPGPAVFSAYGFVGTDPQPTIYHTNRALPDNNDPGGLKNKVSTFAVTVHSDLNRDLRVDLLDFAILAENWLTGAL